MLPTDPSSFWEGNHVSFVNLRPSGPEKFTQFFSRASFILGERQGDKL